MCGADQTPEKGKSWEHVNECGCNVVVLRIFNEKTFIIKDFI